MKTNQFKTEINTRATRNFDATVKMGEIELVFKGEKIHMKLSRPTLRDKNKQIVADIESILGKHIGKDVNAENINVIAAEIEHYAKILEV